MFWIIVVGVLVLGGIAAFYIMRMLKGKVRINLYKTDYVYGEAITGTVSVLARKPIQSTRLLLTLIGEETRYYRDNDGDQESRTREIFRNEIVIDKEKTYSAGDSDEIKFSIPGVPGDTAKSLTGAVVQAGLEIISGERREVEWKLVARLDCPGLDLVHTTALLFN